VLRIKEKKCVEETIRRVGVSEEQLPGVAAVGGFVNAGEVAFAGGHDDGGIGVESLDAAEVQMLCAGRSRAMLPNIAAVFGAENGAVGSRGPGDVAADGVDTAQVGGGGGVFKVPLGVCTVEGCEK